VLRQATPIVRALNVPESLGLTIEERSLLNQLLHKVRAAVVAPGFHSEATARMADDEPT
jgi:hypothetical protein